MKRLGIIFLVFLTIVPLIFGLTSCRSASDGDHPSMTDKGSESEMSGGMSSGKDTVIADRKIIKTVNENVETEKYDEFIVKLNENVDLLGGYISSSVYEGTPDSGYGSRNAKFTVRIPAEKLSEFTGKVGTLATVVSFEEKIDDVTLKYVDVASRIEVLEAEYTALLGILSGASTTADILTIRNQISDVQMELASLKAQKEAFDSQIAYSTVNLSVFEVQTEAPVNNSFFAKVSRTFTASLHALGSFFSAIGVFLLGGSPIILFVAVLVGAVFFTLHLINKRLKKKQINNTENGKDQ